jgi:hypothetical protein
MATPGQPTRYKLEDDELVHKVVAHASVQSERALAGIAEIPQIVAGL